MKGEGWLGDLHTLLLHLIARVLIPLACSEAGLRAKQHGEVWTCYCTSTRWYRSCQLPALMGQESSLPPAAQAHLWPQQHHGFARTHERS